MIPTGSSRLRGIAIAAVMCAVALSAAGQGASAATEDDISVNIEPRYITAYRDGSWAPVDIVVQNMKHDITGWVELRSFAGNDLQGPIYRVPADLPRGSRKRFRLYCRFSGSTRIEVMLYGRQRAELSLPMRVDLRPISNRDALCLILNDEPGEFGFLVRAAQTALGGGFYHDTLDSSMLPLMPDRVECYDGYNAVILGEIDAERVPSEARKALRAYVESGGALIIVAGANAPIHRGSWIEELAGVQMAEPRAWTESDLAEAVFAPESRKGASPARQCLVAPLTPGGACTAVVGLDTLLATYRPFAQGHIVTLAVGPKDDALLQCAGMLELWEELLTLHPPAAGLRITAAASAVGNQLPQVAGVRIAPRSIVVAYLGLYLLVGVALNWTVWTLLRRREMAWVCLIFISIAFTAFAVVYGSAGRLRAAELHEYQVIEVPAQGDTARIHSLTGVLSARSSSYDFDVALEKGLVQEAAAFANPMGGRGILAAVRNRPFQWRQTDPQRVHGMAVGASLARVVVVQGVTQSPGRATGRLVTSPVSGQSESTVVWSGPPLERPVLYYQGVPYDLSDRGDAYVVGSPAEGFGSGFGPWVAGNDRFLSQNLLGELMGGSGPAWLSPDSAPRKPYLCGWTPWSGESALEPNQQIANLSQYRLIVAEIDESQANPDGTRTEWLAVRGGSSGMFPGMSGAPGGIAGPMLGRPGALMTGGELMGCSLSLAPGQESSVWVMVPEDLSFDRTSTLDLYLSQMSTEDVVDVLELALVREGLPDQLLDRSEVDTGGARGTSVPTARSSAYAAPGWRVYHNPATSEVEVRIRAGTAKGDTAETVYAVAAKITYSTRKPRGAAWRAWHKPEPAEGGGTTP